MAAFSYGVGAHQFLYWAACGKAESEEKEKNMEGQEAGEKV